MKFPLIHVVLSLALFALVGCSDTKTTVAAAAPVSTPAPAPSDPAEELVISGPIVVENQIDLAAQRDGVESAAHAQEGRAKIVRELKDEKGGESGEGTDAFTDEVGELHVVHY